MPNHPIESPGSSGEHRWAFLVNPVSGNGCGLAIKEQIAGTLRGMGLADDRWICEVTQPGAQLVEQVKKLSESFDRVVVAGGDGTIGLAIQGIAHGNSSGCALGVVPIGTGNDLARELRLLSSFRRGGLKSLLEAFFLDRTAPLDLWSVNGRATMVNYLSLGLDGKSTETFARRRILGGNHSLVANKLRFGLSGILSLGHRLPDDFRLRIHSAGGFRDILLGGKRTVAILNISHYAAGLMRIAGTRPDDNQLTAVCIGSMATYGGLLARRFFTLGRVGPGMLPTWKGDRIECFWSGDVGLQIDGEGRNDLRKCGHLDITCHSRIQVLVGVPEAEE
jgi:diacylglycerol kinase (ATP)